MQNKKILILTTGGTIAGNGEDQEQSANYKAGAISGNMLLALLPPTQAELQIQEIAQIDSIEVTPKLWRELLLALNQAYDGFVITHGTDTLEESSFVVDLLYPHQKPVVFVGAMRPSNAIGSDGIKNLCNAIALASNPQAKGVMVLMNDKIYNPKTIYKAHTYNLDAFKSRNGGEMGYVLDSKVFFFASPCLIKLPFGLDDLQDLPKVEIVYIYAGMTDLPQYPYPLDGLVIAGCGAGNLPTLIKEKLKAQKIPIVTSSRGSEGFVQESEFIPAFGLNVAKARILLALCLQHFKEEREIKQIFSLL